LEEKDWADFLGYEERLNRYLSDKAMLALCAYPLATPRAAEVTRAHPSTIKKQRGEWEVHQTPQPLDRARESRAGDQQ
jgi:hypothetical protein